MNKAKLLILFSFLTLHLFGQKNNQLYAFANVGIKKISKKFILKFFFLVNRDIDYFKYSVSSIALVSDRNVPRNRFIGLGISAGYYF